MKSDGRPMRALHALADTDPARPLDEYGVWRAAGRRGSPYSRALATLVARGLVERTGRPGCYQWYITPAGTAALLGESS